LSGAVKPIPFRTWQFRFVLFALCVVAPLCLSTRCAADDEPAPVESVALDLPSYENELTRIADGAKNAGQIAELRRSLPVTWMVSAGEQRIEVPTAAIREALWSMEKDAKKSGALLQGLEARLRLMRDDAERMGAQREDAASRAAADAKLKEILGRREFNAATGPTEMQLLQARIRRWILQTIIGLFDRLHISQATGNLIAWVVIGAATIVLFVVIYQRLKKTPERAEFRAEAEFVAGDSRHWLQEAMRAAERGDYREAMHCGYWAAVARLEDLRLLPQDRARTPRESLRLLDRNPKEQGFLRAITGRFELIWYGYHPATAEDWGLAKEQLEKMGCQSSTALTGRS
jgi:Domain of unknown function (DUF4129)